MSHGSCNIVTKAGQVCSRRGTRRASFHWQHIFPGHLLRANSHLQTQEFKRHDTHYFVDKEVSSDAWKFEGLRINSSCLERGLDKAADPELCSLTRLETLLGVGVGGTAWVCSLKASGSERGHGERAFLITVLSVCCVHCEVFSRA